MFSDPNVTYIPANSTFTTVNNIVNQIPEVDTSSLDAVNLTAENITINESLNQLKTFAGLGTLKQVVGYVPNSTAGTRFAKLPAGQGVFLNKVPAYASATVLTDPPITYFTVDSIVVGARVTQ